MIVDSHLHLWNPEDVTTPWRAGWARLAHGPSFTADQALLEMERAGVELAAIIPAAWDVAGNELVLQSARRHPDRFAAFVSPDMRRPRTAADLSCWLRPGGRGFRVMFPPGQSRSWLADGTADWLWPVASELGVPVMVWAPGQLPALGAIARDHPELKLIIDHLNLGMTPAPAEGAAAVDDLIRLAKLPNVAVKASALPCAGPGPLSLLQRTVNAFGAERVFWGSDLGRLPISYEDALAMVRDAPGMLSARERKLVLGIAFLDWIDWQIPALP